MNQKRFSLVLGLLALAGCGEVDNPLIAPTTRLTADDLCDTYCVTLWQHCRQAWRPYASPQICRQVCQTFPTDGQIGDTTGDTLQCRLTYALYARRHNESSLCRLAGPDKTLSCFNAP